MLLSRPRFFLLAIVLGVLAIGPVSSQYFRQSSYWNTRREEMEFGFGISNLLCEIRGQNQIRSPLVWHLELS